MAKKVEQTAAVAEEPIVPATTKRSRKKEDTAEPTQIIGEQEIESLILSTSDIEEEKNYNVRHYEALENVEHFNATKATILAGGISVPLKVRPSKKEGKYILIQGYTRLRAAQAIEAETGSKVSIPVTVSRSGSKIDRLYDLTVSNSGKKLTMLERSDLVAKLIQEGEEKGTIAKRFGETVANIDHLVVLTLSTDAVRDLIKEGRVSSSAVVDLLRNMSPEDAEAEIVDMLAKKEKSGDKKGVSKTDVKKGVLKEVKVSTKAIEELLDNGSISDDLNEDRVYVVRSLIDWAKGDMSDDDFIAVLVLESGKIPTPDEPEIREDEEVPKPAKKVKKAAVIEDDDLDPEPAPKKSRNKKTDDEVVGELDSVGKDLSEDDLDPVSKSLVDSVSAEEPKKKKEAVKAKKGSLDEFLEEEEEAPAKPAKKSRRVIEDDEDDDL